MSDLSGEVLDFVAETTGCDRGQLSRNHRLFHDLGVDGEDASELLDAFSARFSVDMRGLDIERHFGPEAGATPLSLVRWLASSNFRRGDELQAIQVGDLILAAETGFWTLPGGDNSDTEWQSR